MELIIDINDKDLLATLSRLQELSEGKGSILPQALEKTGETVGVYMISPAFFAEYPTRQYKELPLFYDRTSASGVAYKSKFKSRRQQAKVMTLAKRGQIPYSRTGELGRSWVYIVVVMGLTVRIEATNTANHAPYVVGDLQNHFLASLGWQNEEEKLRQGEAQLTNRFANNLQRLTSEIDKQLMK